LLAVAGLQNGPEIETIPLLTSNWASIGGFSDSYQLLIIAAPEHTDDKLQLSGISVSDQSSVEMKKD
jgi:hypothetical protein